MKFLIQQINGTVKHDFAFTLLESIHYQNWMQNNRVHIVRFFKTYDSDNQPPLKFKEYQQNYIPIGSVRFVEAWFQQFYEHTIKPINIPTELMGRRFTQRKVFNGTNRDLEKLRGGYFIKTNTKIKGFAELLNISKKGIHEIPEDDYQISNAINIISEWRVFVYRGQLVGLQNYSGDFTKFPNLEAIKEMIKAYQSAPIAYTLDVGMNSIATFVIEVHDFFSCGLYGFADHRILPNMFSNWHKEYLIKHGLK